MSENVEKSGGCRGGATLRRFSRVGATGAAPIDRPVAEETPIAFEFNGIGYAVLMATPADLDDLAVGFTLSERLIDSVADILDVDVAIVPAGVIVRVALAPSCAERIAERVRHRVAETSCGLCGIENLEQALRPLPSVAAQVPVAPTAVFRALDGIEAQQPLGRATGAAHAAACCTAEGEVVLVREDVGRHNAFDKLIGALLRQGRQWHGGFALLTSRCSYELVEKAVLSGCPMLVTISAPTNLALERARAAGLVLRTLARRDSYLEFLP